MHDMIRQGKALYWGTSEWSASEIMAAWQIAERHHLAKPVVEQPQYNLFHRRRVESEYRHLYNDIGLGLTTLEPARLGAPHRQVPRRACPRTAAAPSRACSSSCRSSRTRRRTPPSARSSSSRRSSAARSRSSPSPGARRTRTSPSVITGASRVEQVKENLKALEFVPKITAPMMERIEQIVAGLGE